MKKLFYNIIILSSYIYIYTIYATYPAAGPINNMNNEVKYNPLYTILIPIKLAQALNDVKQPHNPVPTPMNRFLSGFIFRH